MAAEVEGDEERKGGEEEPKEAQDEESDRCERRPKDERPAGTE